MFYKARSYKICWLVCIIFFLVGIFLMDVDTEVYSTDEYWVASNYHHVYDKYTKEIVNLIEEDETCKIKKNEIVVSTKKCGNIGYTSGGFFCVFSGITMLYLTFIFFKEIWQEKHKEEVWRT